MTDADYVKQARDRKAEAEVELYKEIDRILAKMALEELKRRYAEADEEED